MTAKFHFTLGPVQGFVSQARRTRDLWAGSYLLSYLAGKAMQASGGEIIFPAVKTDELMKAIEGPTKPKKHELAAQVGSLPNRFAAEVKDDDAGSRAKKAVQGAWEEIAGAVWDKYLASSFDEGVEKIWKRQIEHFWDCTWVYGEDGALLDQRKNLRTYFPKDEPGEKCTVCGERQEISGMGLGSARSRQQMRDWWLNFRQQAGLSALDIRDNERLCAVCLIKRLFPKVAKHAIGWEVPIGFPSVSYIAAVEWIESLFDSNDPAVEEAVRVFVEACNKANVGKSEQETRISGITANLKGRASHWLDLADFDGSIFFEESISNQSSPYGDKAQRDELVSKLKKVQNSIGTKASPFYALLLMDGDSMGALLNNRTDEQKKKISGALGQFGQAVPGVVKACDGRLIYCGGDDVFALMPMERALECARKCREAYQKAFKDSFKDSFKDKTDFIQETQSTISAAIVYVHIHVPLSVAVHQAHVLLDEVAKDRTGRDAVACQVFKPGGITLTWAMPWRKVLDTQKVVDKAPLLLVQEILWRFQNLSEGKHDDKESQFSNKFFYKARALFDLLTDKDGRQIFGQDQSMFLLAVDYLANREQKWPKEWDDAKIRAEAELRVGRLLTLCTEYHRTLEATTGEETIDPTGRISADGAMLVRFLAQKGVE